MRNGVHNVAEGIKNCNYPGCENTILADNEFGLCEVCRALSVRNAITITLDPFSPISDRRDMIFGAAIKDMKPEEIMNAVHKVEWAYLELQKTLKSAQLDAYRKTKFAEGIELVNGQRNEPKTPKVSKKKDTKRAKLVKLGLDDETARELMGQDFNDL